MASTQEWKHLAKRTVERAAQDSACVKEEDHFSAFGENCKPEEEQLRWGEAEHAWMDCCTDSGAGSSCIDSN